MKKRDGFLYILRHPDRTFTDYGLKDDEHLFKIGVTTKTMKIRLKQHNTDYSKVAGMVVEETGHLWDIHEVYSVRDVYLAEKIFWRNSPFADIPFLNGEEVMPMKPADIQSSIEAVIRLCDGTYKLESI